MDELLSVSMFQDINPESECNCRKVLQNSFTGYREGRNAEVLKRLLGEYKEYISCCQNEHAKDRYNAFVYRYMVEVHVGSKAIASRLGVVKETIFNYIDRCLDEILMLCMGVPAVRASGDKESIIHMLVDGSRLFHDMEGDYILDLFPGQKERAAVVRGRQFTKIVMKMFDTAVEAYSAYCNDEHPCIDTNIRKAEILRTCIAGVRPAAIAKEYECCETTIYADIRENERRLAAMLFDAETG